MYIGQSQSIKYSVTNKSKQDGADISAQLKLYRLVYIAGELVWNDSQVVNFGPGETKQLSIDFTPSRTGDGYAQVIIRSIDNDYWNLDSSTRTFSVTGLPYFQYNAEVGEFTYSLSGYPANTQFAIWVYQSSTGPYDFVAASNRRTYYLKTDSQGNASGAVAALQLAAGQYIARIYNQAKGALVDEAPFTAAAGIGSAVFTCSRSDISVYIDGGSDNVYYRFPFTLNFGPGQHTWDSFDNSGHTGHGTFNIIAGQQITVPITVSSGSGSVAPRFVIGDVIIIDGEYYTVHSVASSGEYILGHGIYPNDIVSWEWVSSNYVDSVAYRVNHVDMSE